MEKDSPSASSGQAGRLQPRDKLGTGGQQADSNLRGEVVVDGNSKSQITVAKVSVYRFQILCFFLLTPET